MPTATIDHARFPRVRAAMLAAFALLLLGGCNPPSRGDFRLGVSGAQSERLRSGTAKPHETRGPYPAEPRSDRPNDEDLDTVRVPTAPSFRQMRPTSPPTRVSALADRRGVPLARPAAFRRGPPPPPLVVQAYRELTNSVPFTYLCCGEVSVAESGATTMMTGNLWMALSTDGGATFSNLDPTTIFPKADKGLCCDQIVAYVPQIDMFVWLLQYNPDDGDNNRIRLAAQTTEGVRSSNGTAWTYWDFVSDLFDPDADLDRNDLAVGEGSLWWNTQVVGGGRVVVRIPLSQIRARGTLSFKFTGQTEATNSHLTQNAANTVYWAGHVTNAELRVFSMRDEDDFYSWRSVPVDNWPNGTNSAACPDSSDWMAFEDNKHQVFGNALQGSSLWLAWLASAGDRYPQPHVQMVRINPVSWTRDAQVQIWSPTVAFQDAYLSTNARGELGMEIAFGGQDVFPSSAVGVLGDFVVYYPRLSTRCPRDQRWGDYNHARRTGANGMEWAAGGYTTEADASGNLIAVPHYIRFSR